jgi:hypothetical protein
LQRKKSPADFLTWKKIHFLFFTFKKIDYLQVNKIFIFMYIGKCNNAVKMTI